MRIGTGYDSHRFAEGRPLILGGVAIPNHPGLTGHSDGDAIAHAVIDAILGAAAAGNVGSHFPPSDEAWKDAYARVDDSNREQLRRFGEARRAAQARSKAEGRTRQT